MIIIMIIQTSIHVCRYICMTCKYSKQAAASGARPELGRAGAALRPASAAAGRRARPRQAGPHRDAAGDLEGTKGITRNGGRK